MAQSFFKTPEGRYIMSLEISTHIHQKHRSLDHYRYNRQGYQLHSDRLDLFVANRIYTAQMALPQEDRSTSSPLPPPPQSHAAAGEERPAAATRRGDLRQLSVAPREGIFLSLNTTGSILIYNALTRSKDLEEPLTHLDCSGARPTCQRINTYAARQSQHIEAIVGFHTGDIALHDANVDRNVFYNRDKLVDKSEVTAVAWFPPNGNDYGGSTSERVSTPSGLPIAASAHTPSTPRENAVRDRGHRAKSSRDAPSPMRDAVDAMADSKSDVRIQTFDCFIAAHASGKLYIYNKKYADEIPLQLSEQPQQQREKYHVLKNKSRHCNPILCIRVSNKRINDIRVSPDGRCMALACADGYLHVIDLRTFSLIVKYQSYYGAFTCCSWSPDGRYIATGGEDDLVTLFDYRNRTIIARGEGHQSYISGVAFDEYRCDDEVYRIVSVGHDSRLLLWEVAHADIESLEDTEAQVAGGLKRSRVNASSASTSSLTGEAEDCVPSLSRAQVPTFEPICSTKIAEEPVLDVVCFPQGYITVDNQHFVRIWARLDEKMPRFIDMENDVAAGGDGVDDLEVTGMLDHSLDKSPSSSSSPSREHHKQGKYHDDEEAMTDLL